MLGCEYAEVVQRVALVSVWATSGGKASGNFVFPCASTPAIPCCICKCLELGCGTTHVRWASEDYRVGSVNKFERPLIAEAAFMDHAAFNPVLDHLNEL